MFNWINKFSVNVCGAILLTAGLFFSLSSAGTRVYPNNIHFYVERTTVDDVNVRNQIIPSGHRNYINPRENWPVR